MSEEKKPQLELSKAVNEAMARFIHGDYSSIEDAYQEVRRKAEEAERYVEERRQSIKKGARRAPKRFRL